MATKKTLEGNQHMRLDDGTDASAATPRSRSSLCMFGLKTAAAAAGMCLAAARAEVMDVVALGAKNDGSADVSAIVNANTAKGALFFPAGIYKVAQPLVLKNPIHGEGYSRSPVVNAARTWLVSEIVCTNGAHGVIEFGGDHRINVENLNVMCWSRECGIRIADCRQNTYTLIDKVGIYNVGAWGLYVKGRGSRPIFASDMTIFGTTKDPTARAAGIRIEGPADCRLTNIEAMGVNIGLELYNGHTYGDNIHLWTGVMGVHEPRWWNDTRGIVLGPGSHFTGSEIYPDTCYYAFDLKDASSFCEIMNVMNWEDGSVKNVKDRTGSLLHVADPQNPGKLVLNGGLVGVGGDDAHPGATTKYYMPSAVVRDVILKSDYAIKGANIDRLCLGRGLPDYTVRYADKGWCKVADIFTVAKTGACEGTLTLDGGAAWRLSVVKGPSGKVEFTTTPLNALCARREIKAVEEEEVLKVFILSPDAAPMAARFTTAYQCDYFRPLDHASLRTRTNAGQPRYRDVRAVVSTERF